MYKVLISFPNCEPGEVLSGEDILKRTPWADIPWLLSVGTIAELPKPSVEEVVAKPVSVPKPKKK